MYVFLMGWQDLCREPDWSRPRFPAPYLQGCGKPVLAVWEAGYLRVTREAGFLRVTREAGFLRVTREAGLRAAARRVSLNHNGQKETGITKSQRTETDGYHQITTDRKSGYH